MNIANKFVATAAALFTSVGSVSATDLPTKAPPVYIQPAPVDITVPTFIRLDYARIFNRAFRAAAIDGLGSAYFASGRDYVTNRTGLSFASPPILGSCGKCSWTYSGGYSSTESYKLFNAKTMTEAGLIGGGVSFVGTGVAEAVGIDTNPFAPGLNIWQRGEAVMANLFISEGSVFAARQFATGKSTYNYANTVYDLNDNPNSTNYSMVTPTRPSVKTTAIGGAIDAGIKILSFTLHF